MLKPEGDKQFVAVTWRDAHGTGKTASFSEHELPHAPARVTTYGWLMRQDDKGLSIVGEIFSDGSMRDYTFIMTEVLEGIEVIRMPAKRRSKKETVQQ